LNGYLSLKRAFHLSQPHGECQHITLSNTLQGIMNDQHEVLPNTEMYESVW